MNIKPDDTFHWWGFLFWGGAALLGVLLFGDQMDRIMRFEVTMFGAITAFVGIWLAPTKPEG